MDPIEQELNITTWDLASVMDRASFHLFIITVFFAVKQSEPFRPELHLYVLVEMEHYHLSTPPSPAPAQ